MERVDQRVVPEVFRQRPVGWLRYIRSLRNVFLKRLEVGKNRKHAYPNNKYPNDSVDFWGAPDTYSHTSWARGCAGVRVVGRGGPSNVAPVNSFSLHGESTGRDGNVEFSNRGRVNHL
jgi:hypothetical protein